MSSHISDKKTENILINEAEIAQNKTVLKSMPRKLELLVTSKCNIRCKMCNIALGEWTFPESKNSEILKLMPYLEEIIWHGGEPLLYPHIYDLIGEASKNNVRQTIQQMLYCLMKIISKNFLPLI
jgi:MoaA/NifB/PqqE/SkfB family radical SAM enzyme